MTYGTYYGQTGSLKEDALILTIQPMNLLLETLSQNEGLLTLSRTQFDET